MMKPFKKIALVSRKNQAGIEDTLLALYHHLADQHYEIILEQETADLVPRLKLQSAPGQQLGQFCDLMIVVGGDGSLLHAARIAVGQNLPVLGINRGRIGFLTDIHPSELAKIDRVLNGEYIEEERFLLNAFTEHQQTTTDCGDALNDVVLLRGGEVVHMIEFDIYINQQFICSQRADGMIIATPTGSTAYALSGGGPILYPTLNAIVLLPMFPHTLSSRPIVIDGNYEITLIMSQNNEIAPYVSCDGRKRMYIEPKSKLIIRKKNQKLRLIHPLDYQYFTTLREKLGWENS